jgi:hypothetical protein
MKSSQEINFQPTHAYKNGSTKECRISMHIDALYLNIFLNAFKQVSLKKLFF